MYVPTHVVESEQDTERHCVGVFYMCLVLVYFQMATQTHRPVLLGTGGTGTAPALRFYV